MKEFWISISHWGMFKITQEQWYEVLKTQTQEYLNDDGVLYKIKEQ